MKTRRSTRNLQQLELQDQNGDLGDEESHRDYDLNYDRAVQKKIRACNLEYSVKSEFKGGNHVFTFSTAMYELYRDKLIEHLKGLDNNPNANIKVKCKDISEKSGMTVESQVRVHQKTRNGCGRLKYTINLYHTNNRIMVNGRLAAQFNSEHTQISEQILACEQVSDLNEALCAQIHEELKQMCVNKYQNETSVTNNMDQQCHPVETNTQGACFQTVEPSGSELSTTRGPLNCPTCDLLLESNPSVCCDRCELWYHFDCENINAEMASLLENSDIGYTCLACTHEVQCEDLNESLEMGNRNEQESIPDVDSEETHKKIGYEPGPVQHQTPTHIAPSSRPKDSNKQSMSKPMTPCPPRAGNLPGTPSLPRGQDNIGSVGLGNLLAQEPSVEPNKSKPQKKVNKSKVKETELEEQLKMSRKVIHSLERKLGEIEKSNKILQQEISILKVGNLESGEALNSNNGGGKFGIPQQQQNSQSHGHIDSLREQVRNLEYQLLQNRISNLEAMVHQQRVSQYPPSGIPGINAFQQNPIGHMPQYHSGFVNGLYHPWIQPRTTQHPLLYGFAPHPQRYQGHPIGAHYIPLQHQYQGLSTGNANRVPQNSMPPRNISASRPNDLVLQRNTQYNGRTEENTAQKAAPRVGPVNVRPEVSVPKQSSIVEEACSALGLQSDPIVIDGDSKTSLPQAEVIDPCVISYKRPQCDPVSIEVESEQYGHSVCNERPPAPNVTQQDTNKQSFLLNGRASEKTWKGSSC